MAHDFKNNITTIKSLSSSPDVINYIDNMMGEIVTYNQHGRNKNKILDIILSKYIDICHDKKISFEIDVVTDNFSFMNNNDISSIFNNILDNAVEAAEMSKQKIITLQITSSFSAYHRITITNSCDNKPTSKNEQLISTKKNKSLHGFGTKSLSQALKKYGGETQWDYDDVNKMFKLTIIIPMDQQS